MRILITDCASLTSGGDLSLEPLKKYGEITEYGNISREELLKEVVNKDIVLCNKTVIDGEVINAAPNLKYIGVFADNGADMISFHLESKSDPAAAINEIKSRGKKAGIAIKPATPVSEVLPYVKSADMVLVMTVEPGFGGQGFMSETLGKIRELRDYINRECPNVHIQVDGGINAETAALVREAGADILVAGSYLFKAADMAAAAGSMR